MPWQTPLAALALAILASACGPNGAAFDAGPGADALDDAAAADLIADATPDADAIADTVPDLIADATPDADAIADTVPDLSADATPDADTVPDLIADTAPDADATTPDLIADQAEVDAAPVCAPPDASPVGDGLGIATPPFCANLKLEVKSTDCPQGGACWAPCAPGYPCTCGACPWVQTPPLNVPRYGAEAVWTGKEMLVFGGTSYPGMGKMPDDVFTGERWNPQTGSGFSMIPLPFDVTTQGGHPPWTRVFWTGDEALVLMEHKQFRYQPDPGKVIEIGPAGVREGSAVFANGRLFWWGGGQGVYDAKKAHLAVWTQASGWQDLPFPAAYLDPTKGNPSWPELLHCAAMAGDDVYVYDPQYGYAAGSGLDPTKKVMLKLHLPTQSWSALPQTMPFAINCHNPVSLFDAFPGGIAIIGWVGVYPNLVTQGQIWWHDKQAWDPMAKPPVSGTAGKRSGTGWFAGRFFIFDQWRQDPVFGAGLYSWPLVYDPYTNIFSYTTGVGAPKHERGLMARAYSGTEWFAVGGTNGIALQTIHTDGVRLWWPSPP